MKYLNRDKKPHCLLNGINSLKHFLYYYEAGEAIIDEEGRNYLTPEKLLGMDAFFFGVFFAASNHFDIATFGKKWENKNFYKDCCEKSKNFLKGFKMYMAFKFLKRTYNAQQMEEWLDHNEEWLKEEIEIMKHQIEFKDHYEKQYIKNEIEILKEKLQKL